MDFHEDSIHPGGSGGARQDWNEFRLPSADCRLVLVAVRGRGKLYGMSRIEDDRRELPHDSERAHVNNKVVISEAGPSLGHKDAIVSRGFAFLDDVFHIPRRHELAFFDVDHALAHGGSDHQVGLAAEKSGNLENVGDFGNLADVGDLMHIGEHGHVDFLLNFFQDPQAFCETRSSKAAYRCAIGLVVRSFKNEREVQRSGYTLDDFRHEDRMFFALNDTRSGDENKVPRTDVDALDLERQFQVSSFKFQEPRGMAAGTGTWTGVYLVLIFSGR